jgi:hypothetical protein
VTAVGFIKHQTAHRLPDYQCIECKAECERVSILVPRVSFPPFLFLSSGSVLSSRLSYNVKPTQHRTTPTRWPYAVRRFLTFSLSPFCSYYYFPSILPVCPVQQRHAPSHLYTDTVCPPPPEQVKHVYIYLSSCSSRRASSLNHKCASFTLPLSACFRVFSLPISTPRLRHHGTVVHVALVAVSRFLSFSGRLHPRRSILATKGSVYRMWLSFLFLLLGNDRVLPFPDEPYLCCWMDSREAGQVQGRHDLEFCFVGRRNGESTQKYLYCKPALPVLRMSPELEFPTEEFAHSESYRSHSPLDSSLPSKNSAP